MRELVVVTGKNLRLTITTRATKEDDCFGGSSLLNGRLKSSLYSSFDIEVVFDRVTA